MLNLICDFVLAVYVHFLILASHSCIIVTEPLENGPVEPAKSVAPEPRVQFVIESEAIQGKQLRMIPYSYLI